MFGRVERLGEVTRARCKEERAAMAFSRFTESTRKVCRMYSYLRVLV
jgi:hypothetical protein